MSSRVLRIMVSMCLAVGATALVSPAANATGQTYKVQIDAQPPTGQPWAFLHFFPGPSISVHQGDVLDFAWSGTDTPHTATLTPDASAAHWRSTNQGPTGAYAVRLPDSQTGGDDHSLVINPKVAGPSDPTCGTSANPCAFDASSVVSSGLQFPNTAAQPSFFVTVNAPVGSYSFLCLLHPGMEIALTVAPAATSVPTPQQVAASAARQVKHVTKVDGAKADAIAQTVTTRHTAAGAIVRINAGGFSNNVTANEYPDKPVIVHAGTKIRFIGMPEIHTATFPRSSARKAKYAFVQRFCELTGADTPAHSPADCSDPTKFELVLNPLVFLPSSSANLVNPTSFVSTGLLVQGKNAVILAKKPGTYRFVCLIHGPTMSSVIKVIA